ncbi:hypothetical protein D9613_003591 [Agrocybe pediades]|uniref:Uncharacterized protein n=1 Tax=Agrocybe pediades TaxID=84607 RepID=A0A8H4QJ69_9AGAR|nr:hypothetical protein D9613_003591 [Agrocybe pediades]
MREKPPKMRKEWMDRLSVALKEVVDTSSTAIASPAPAISKSNSSGSLAMHSHSPPLQSRVFFLGFDIFDTDAGLDGNDNQHHPQFTRNIKYQGRP